MVSGSCALPPRWPPQWSCVVIESSFDPGERLQAPGSLWFCSLTVLTIWFPPDCLMEMGLQSILKRNFDSYFDIILLGSHDMILFRKWKPDGQSCDCTFICAVNILARLCQSLSWAFLIESAWRLSVCKLFTNPTSSEPLHSQSPNLTQMFLYGSCK